METSRVDGVRVASDAASALAEVAGLAAVPFDERVGLVDEEDAALRAVYDSSRLQSRLAHIACHEVGPLHFYK